MRWDIFKHEFVANLPVSLSTKKRFKKLVNIWGSYGQDFSILLFFDSRCRIEGQCSVSRPTQQVVLFIYLSKYNVQYSQ